MINTFVLNVFIYRGILATVYIPENEWSFEALTVKEE